RLVAGFGVLAGVGEGLAGLPSFSLSFPGARYPSERSASVVASSGVPAGRGTPASRAGGGAWCGPRPAIQRPSATPAPRKTRAPPALVHGGARRPARAGACPGAAVPASVSRTTASVA